MIKRILLPFLPDNTKLQSHWWHRLIKTISLLVNTVIYIIVFLLLLHFPYSDFRAYMLAPSNVYTVQDAKTVKMVSLGSDELGKQAKKIDYTKYSKMSDDMAGVILLQKLGVGDTTSGETNKIIEASIKSRPSWMDGFQPLSKVQIRSELTDSATPIVVLILLAFFPAVIYRTLLYITLDNSWKKIS